MRRAWLLALTACRFHPGAAQVVADAPKDAAPPDVAIDAPPPFCPADAHLRLCFSFDQQPLPSPLGNEGAAAVSADLTNVTSVASPLGRAAQLDATSEIYLAMGSGVTAIAGAEIWFRYDTEIAANGARMGLYDSNVASPNNISLFLYRADPAHVLQCGLGDQTGRYTVQVQPGTWYHAECVCEANSIHLVLDGMDYGPQGTGCASGGAFVGDGFTIGQNNNGGPTGVNDWWIGAIDGIRLWDTLPP